MEMRKTTLPLKKTASVQGEAQDSQRKISAFFTKCSINERVKDNSNSAIVSNVLCKKRKINNEFEANEVQLKVQKSNNTCASNSNASGITEVINKSGTVNNTSHKNEQEICKHKIISNTNIPKERSCNYKENVNTFDTVHAFKSQNMKTSPIGIEIAKDALLQEDIWAIDPFDEIHKANEFVAPCTSVNEYCKDSDFTFGTYATDDFNECFDEEWSNHSKINLNSFQRCKVIDIKRERNVTTLIVEHGDFASTTVVTCLGFWKDVHIEKDDIVAIQGKKENENWIVDNNNGFLVIHPDILISGTTIVGALFCTRKAVLTEKFRKIESLPYYKGDSMPMIIGNLVHQLLQKAIQQNIREPSDVTKLLDSILRSAETTSILYASDINFDDCQEKMIEFVPKIFQFIQHYVNGNKQQEIDIVRQNFNGRITRVHDIEENIWLPKLGIKGKVDVTVEVSINSKRKAMPLEIKTGKPSFSLEHKGQVILYTVMMALTGQDTDAGLLLYLRDNSIQEIRGCHVEKRDLILLRNTLANYFTSKPVEPLSLSETEWPSMELPEPINHHSACARCSYNTLCCMYLSRDPHAQVSESHPLKEISKQIFKKLRSTHIDYVIKWVLLLHIEETAQTSKTKLEYLWTLSPEKREAKGICICNLKVIGKVKQRDSKYQHTFVRVREQISTVNIAHTNFTENEYVLVSTNTRVNISAGFILDIKDDSITLLLERNVTKYNVHATYHIDKYSSNNLYTFNLGNIAGLLGDDETCAKLRDIVIDRKPAEFTAKLPRSIIVNSAEILRELNRDQQRAIMKAMTADDYILIKGMPGTGKTQTLVALISLLNQNKLSVLVTAHTNSAVDNILLKLMNKGIDFLRLGSTSSVHPLLMHKTEAHATSNCDTPQSLEEVYSSKNIIGVTCYGAHHALLGKRMFDVCLIDECAQALQPAVLRPLYSARKFILVGDPDQLPPIIKSNTARKLGASESLFLRLDSENNTVNLTEQYRMNKCIMRLANKLTYQDKLKAGSALIENTTFNAPYSQNLAKQEKWVQRVLSQDINDSVTVLNTGCTFDLKLNLEFNKKYAESDQIHSNIWEAAIICRLLSTLDQLHINPRNIGIIAPYRSHVMLLKTVVHTDVEVNTVDQYQGRDKEIILYSCAKSFIKDCDFQDDDILNDCRRLTVAVTRAKHKLIIIADKYTLLKFASFKRLFELVEERNTIDLHDGSDGFSWQAIGSLLC